jgi:hypothetical protein
VLFIADTMRRDLIATFNSNKTHETISTAINPATSPKPTSPAQDLISFDEPRDEATVAAESARRARQMEAELTQMQALRRSALAFLDKWRAGVMHRICDVICVRGKVV